MEERVRQGTVVLSLDRGVLQVGTSPGHSFVLTHISSEDEKWLRDLTAPTRTPRRAANTLRGGSPSREAIVDLLQGHDLLVRSPQRPGPADLCMRITGLDRIGIPLARTLRTIGVTHLDLRDRRTIDHEVEYLFPPGARGLSRQRILQEEMRGRNCFLSRQSDSHLVVSVENRVVDHARAGLLLGRDISHLPIVVDDRSIQVGPLCIPERTCCLLCLDFHRTDALPEWPTLREQLRHCPAPPPSPAMAATAASLAVQMIESVVTAASPRAASAHGDPNWYHGLAWRVFEGGIEQLRWDPHPKCSCSGQSLDFSPKEATPRSP